MLRRAAGQLDLRAHRPQFADQPVQQPGRADVEPPPDVDPQGARHGGTHCLECLLEDLCRERGVKAVRLEVEHANVRARRVYEKAGYVAHERHLMTHVLTDAVPRRSA